MLRRVAVIRTYVLEERITSIIMMTRIGELETTLAVAAEARCEETAYSCHPDDGEAKFLVNAGNYKSHTA
jgi:hypothetical protein